MSEQSEQKNKMGKKHLILMILCCMVPTGVFFVLFALGIPINRLFLFVMILLCPLSHIFMMRGMKHHEYLEEDIIYHRKEVKNYENESRNEAVY